MTEKMIVQERGVDRLSFLRVGYACLIFGLSAMIHDVNARQDVRTEQNIQVCFTPRKQCLPLILGEIRKARKEILVQAYQLTSKSIARALQEDHLRGVSVMILADKSQEVSRYSQIPFLTQAGIDVRIDDRVAIAHNKVILIDGHILIGGSYNDSESAEKRNAENLLIIRDHGVIAEYREN
ncbi:phospholipase D precursor [Caedimonas varicaedens]|uniref:phospholipase D n=1 Tax=Caedimonas varicaedens TaxID=1629334 RepID=A0A0K8MAU7_9PROT|nr:phospholipase D precursor [Caedimonas varicaedens]